MATTCVAGSYLSATGTASFPAETHAKELTCAGDSDIVDSTQSIGTASEVINTGEIAGGGAKYIEIKNLDAANFVSFGFETPCVAGVKTFKLLAGASALLPTPSGALYAIADTDAVTILVKAVEL